MVVLIDLAHVQNGRGLVDIPKNDLTVHRAAGENDRFSWMPGDSSDTVWHLNVNRRFLGIERPTERCKDAYDRLMLTPGDVISLTVGRGEGRTVAIPCDARNLVIRIKAAHSSILHGDFRKLILSLLLRCRGG